MLLSFRGHNLRHFSQGSNQFQFATATSRCHICKHKMEANCSRKKADVERKSSREAMGAGPGPISPTSACLSVIILLLLARCYRRMVEVRLLSAAADDSAALRPTWSGFQLKVEFTPDLYVTRLQLIVSDMDPHCGVSPKEGIPLNASRKPRQARGRQILSYCLC